MDDVKVEQLILIRSGTDDCRVQARSPGFLDEWVPHAERLCVAFGERPKGVPCPSCVFAQPFVDKQVVIVQVADSASNSLGFHFLVFPFRFYSEYLGDPFVVSDRFPPPWPTRGELPTASWPLEPLPPRTVEEVRRVLQRVKGSGDTPLSPVMLGAAQALVDGGRIVFERRQPDTELLRDLWTLLPHSTRNRLWPASFAFGNELGFDLVVVPNADGDEFRKYLTEEQAADYPQGRYELRLQIAAEAGDQQELDALFARRSRAQVFRLGLVVLAGMIVLLVLSSLLRPAFAP